MIPVSVVLPTRNRATLLPRAIESVRRQTLPDWELIVVDDASTDSTRDVIADFIAQDERVSTIRLETKSGAAAARNRAVRQARGEFVGLLDDDDEWLPRKLERQWHAARSAGNPPGVLHGPFLEVDPAGLTRLRNTAPLPAAGAREALLRGNRIGHSTALIRQTVFEQVGGYDARLPRLQDWDLWLRAAAVAPFLFVPAPLARVHATPGSISLDPDALREASRILVAKIRSRDGAGSRAANDVTIALCRLLLRAGVDSEALALLRRLPRRQLRAGDRLLAGLVTLLRPPGYRLVSRAATRLLDRRAAVAARRRTPEIDP